MKGLHAILGIACLFAASTPAQISGPSKRPLPVNEQISKLIQDQRNNKVWMAEAQCPADSRPEADRRPKLSASECSDNPGACLAACDRGSADSCHALARLIQDHAAVDNDVADVLYRRSCRLGLASGCTNAAARLYDLDGVEDQQCATRTFELSCLKNDPWGCTMNGLALGTGIGRKRDVPAALRSLDKACQIAVDKNGEACVAAKRLKTTLERTDQ